MKNKSGICNQESVIGMLFSRKGTFIFLSLNLCLFLLFFTKSIDAQAFMSNNAYKVHFGNLNSAAGKGTNSQYKLGVTVGQIAPGLYTGANYTVRAGFQYISSIIPFSFSISSQFIDFGPITPGTPITRTNNLTVSNGSAYGYQVLASENHPLRISASGIDIPDTTCDSGTCSETTASAWTSVLTYGFGYRCDNVNGTDCDSSFSTSTKYKQFANAEASETAQSVMSSLNVGRSRQVQITYKANITAIQAAGEYKNIITYIAIPSI